MILDVGMEYLRKNFAGADIRISEPTV